MYAVFVTCLLIGGLVLIAQVVLSLIGMDADVDVPDVEAGGTEISHGLELLSVRSLSAAAVVFGAMGLWLNTILPTPLAVGLAVVPALAAAWLSAWATRQMTRFESSGTLRLQNAVGQSGRVTLTIRKGAEFGLIQVLVQGRTIELRAVTRDPEDSPEGTAVVVVAVDHEGQTVEVVPTSIVEEI
jgi:membrane protein implicated in regulation of membrane protease activity